MDVDFGDFRLKRTERVLLGPEGPLELSARCFDILARLLERPDEVTGKAELLDAAWPGLVVEENTLQVHVSALRKLLPAGMIVTVHGRGYRYAGPRPVAAGTETAASSRPSIAVFPFGNMSGDPEQDYFSDGITEGIITELGRFREFLVIARNSSFRFRGKANDLAEAARKLDVQYVVEGSVRKIDNRVRIALQLTDVSSMAHVWGEHYDRELDDIFAVQDDIARTIATRLARQARTAIALRTRARPTTSMSAYEAYLRALPLAAAYDTATQAEPFLRQATRIDPQFAAAHAMLGFVEAIKFYWDYTNPRHLHLGLEAARTALDLDPDEAYGHLAAGFAHLFLRQFRQAEISLDRAAELNPNDPFILTFRALFLSYTGRPEQGLVEITEGQRRDPYAVGWYEDYRGTILTSAGRYREAIACFAKMAEIPRWSLVRLVICHAELGETRQARDILAKVKAHYPGLTLDELVDMELDFFEDSAVCRGYREILQRVDGQEQGFKIAMDQKDGSARP